MVLVPLQHTTRTPSSPPGRASRHARLPESARAPCAQRVGNPQSCLQAGRQGRQATLWHTKQACCLHGWSLCECRMRAQGDTCLLGHNQMCRRLPYRPLTRRRNGEGPAKHAGNTSISSLVAHINIAILPKLNNRSLPRPEASPASASARKRRSAGRSSRRTRSHTAPEEEQNKSQCSTLDKRGSQREQGSLYAAPGRTQRPPDLGVGVACLDMHGHMQHESKHQTCCSFKGPLDYCSDAFQCSPAPQ